MRIAIDASMVRRGALTGVERYTICLLHGLASLQTTDDVFVFSPSEVHEQLEPLTRAFTFLRSPFPSGKYRVVRDQLWIPAMLRRHRIDVVHYPFTPPALASSTAAVLTLHDAGLYLFPELMAPLINYYHKPLIRAALYRGVIRVITTASVSAQKDICATLGLDEEFVVPLYQGLPEEWNSAAKLRNDAEILRRYGVSGPCILAVGMYMPLKNIGTLLEAFQTVRATIPSCTLFVVGRKGWDASLPIENPPPGVIFTGYLNDTDLQRLMKSANVFAFPSRYEGFGLPLLEAMSLGIPTVCSDIAVFHEVAAEAVLYADPSSARQFAEGILAILQNSSVRDELIQRGRRRATTFQGSEAFGRNLMTIYRSVHQL